MKDHSSNWTTKSQEKRPERILAPFHLSFVYPEPPYYCSLSIKKERGEGGGVVRNLWNRDINNKSSPERRK